MKAIQHSKGHVCVKFEGKGKEVSISFDDSCQQALPTTMFRVSLKIYKGEKDITNETFASNELYSPSIADLIKALQTLL